jgi:hypothetical protein
MNNFYYGMYQLRNANNNQLYHTKIIKLVQDSNVMNFCRELFLISLRDFVEQQIVKV